MISVRGSVPLVQKAAVYEIATNHCLGYQASLAKLAHCLTSRKSFLLLAVAFLELWGGQLAD
jgi:hypothetical protein